MNFPLWLHRLWQELRALANTHTPRVLYEGIDVSEWNGPVNFEALKGKIDFAILRCGYGGNHTSQDDSCFRRNAAACDAAHIPFGVYLYAYAQNTAMAREEAAHTLRLLNGRDPDFGVWYDIEDASLPYGRGLPAICRTYCETIQAAGCTCVGLYASLSVMEDYLSGPELKPFDKWVAQWDSGACDYPDPGIWQFTDRAVLNGQEFDKSYAYRDYLDLTGANMTQEKFNQMMDGFLAQLEQKSVSSWAKSEWEQACRKGIFDGDGPRSYLSREQAAVVMKRLKLF